MNCAFGAATEGRVDFILDRRPVLDTGLGFFFLRLSTLGKPNPVSSTGRLRLGQLRVIWVKNAPSPARGEGLRSNLRLFDDFLGHLRLSHRSRSRGRVQTRLPFALLHTQCRVA